MFFKDRTDAGRKLAQVFLALGRDFTGWEVVGLARGGIVVAHEVAKALGLPLQSLLVDDLRTAQGTWMVSSLGPGMWIADSDSKYVFVDDISSVQTGEVSELLSEVRRRDTSYNNGNPFRVPDRVILCDDGFVSGRSALVATKTLLYAGAQEVVLGVPVVPPWAMESNAWSEVVTWRVTKLRNPTSGIFYFQFADTPDADVSAAVADSNQGVLS